MDVQTLLRPTGRRKITLPQFQAEPAGPVPFSPTSPGRMLAAFKRAAPALGVSRRVVDFVDYLMSHNRPHDWDSGPGPIVWPSDVELEDRLCIGPSQRKALVRAALDGGFVRLRRSPTGRRWGHRTGGGYEARIMEAYGFDLSPLGERMAEFELASAEWEARRDEGKRLRREITVSRNRVLSMVDLALSQNLAGEDWPAAAAQANALWGERGAQRDPLSLVPIAARLRALAILTQECLMVALAVVESEENDPAGPENRPHLTTTNELIIAKASTTPAHKAGPDRPKAHEEAGNDDLLSQRVVVRKGTVGPSRESPAQASALRGFVVTPMFLLTVAPTFRDWVNSARAGWAELYGAADFVRSGLGISPYAWGQACIVLGRQEAVVALAAICARHADGKVKSPDGLLRCMVELHGKGTLRLDRTLFGLAAKLNKNQRQL
jgi:replication initiation protein RepC